MPTPLSLFNSRHSLLRKALRDAANNEIAMEIFLTQHAFVHSREVSNSPTMTLADEALSGLSETAFRAIPIGCEHSIAWILWHLARIEDVTMNMLLMDGKQVFTTGKWQEKLNISVSDTGNRMPAKKIAQLNKQIDIRALLKYRDAVGKRTCKNVLAVEPAQWIQKVDPERIARLVPEGAVNPVATGVLEYWESLTYAGLLLMPPTRHNLIHLNEIMKMKKKLLSLDI
jgi:DinB superfamily